MTEAEWLTCDDPLVMVGVAKQMLQWPRQHYRKHELFAAACCRLVWPWIVVDDRCRRAVEATESQFEIDISEDDFDELWTEVKDAARHPDEGTPTDQMQAAQIVYNSGNVESVVGLLVCDREESDWGDTKGRVRRVAALLREIVGNPFRPVTFDPVWRTADVLALAQQCCDSRDFTPLPILADALQDAGCDADELLTHLRSDVEHVRGCWALDLVLGKS